MIGPVVRVAWNQTDELPDTTRGTGGFAIIGIPFMALVMDPIAAGAQLALMLCISDIVALRYWRPTTWSIPDLKVLIPGQLLGIGAGYLFMRIADRNLVAIVMALVTLWFAVTGKMLGGKVVNHQTITREEALIAHTRSNAYLLFMEKELGTLEAGKLADLVVLDRDYMTVPLDDILNIKPVMTMTGGKIVYEAK